MKNFVKPKNILVTGVTASGKSSVSKELNKLGYTSYSVEDIKGLFRIMDKSTGKEFKNYSNFDLEKVKNLDWNIDTQALKNLLNSNTKNTVFYCGTASNMDEIFKYFDKVLVLIASDENTRHRLSTRKTNDFGRTKEVQDWVLSWKTWWEETMLDHGAIAIDANQTIDKVAQDIVELAQ